MYKSNSVKKHQRKVKINNILCSLATAVTITWLAVRILLY